MSSLAASNSSRRTEKYVLAVSCMTRVTCRVTFEKQGNAAEADHVGKAVPGTHVRMNDKAWNPPPPSSLSNEQGVMHAPGRCVE
jgi:hypothetical protein